MTRRIGRRAFASGLAGLVVSLGAFCLPHASGAQQSASPRLIGVLLVEFSLESKEAQAFRQGLRDAGYAEGRDVVIEWRSADGDYARIPELAVRSGPAQSRCNRRGQYTWSPGGQARHVHYPDRHGGHGR